MSKKEFFPSDDLKLFFDNLLKVKQYVKEAAACTENEVIKDIYEKLDHIIKEKE